MRCGLLISLAGAAVLGLLACKPAAGPGASANGPTYACVSVADGKTATCMQFSGVPGGAAARLRQGCLVVPGQSFGSACPTDGLVGCCAQKLPDGGNPETCYYKGGPLMGSPEQCAKDGGAWSAAP